MFRKPALAAFLALVASAALSGSGSASVTNTRITSGPSGTVATDSVTFTFTSPEDGGFQCRLDGDEWSACSSPQAYDGLADGPHTLRSPGAEQGRPPRPDPLGAELHGRDHRTRTRRPELPPIVSPRRSPSTAGRRSRSPGRASTSNRRGHGRTPVPGRRRVLPLTSFKQVPMGCLVNTRHGTIALTSSKGSSGELQDADLLGRRLRRHPERRRRPDGAS